MAIKIPVPASSWSSQDITLGGQDYNFVYEYNPRDERWRLSIYMNEEPVVVGIKIMENQRLLINYRLDEFDHGDIACVRFKDDGLPVGRDNLGIGKSYELLYLSSDELEEE